MNDTSTWKEIVKGLYIMILCVAGIAVVAGGLLASVCRHFERKEQHKIKRLREIANMLQRDQED